MAARVRAHDRFEGNGCWSPKNLDHPDEDRRLFFEQARDGSSDAIRQLVQSYWRDVCLYFGRRLAKARHIAAKVEAGDLTQEVSKLVWQKFAGFRGQTLGQYRKWLFTIAGNEWAGILRHYAPGTGRDVLLEQAFDEALAACHGYGRGRQAADDVLAELEDRAELDGALAQLPADQRQAVEWRYFNKLTVAAIAARLGWSRDSVKRTLAAALAACGAACA